MKRVLLLLSIALVGLPVAHGEDLLQVYELALTNDAQLRAAQATKNSTLEVKPQARAQLLPNIGLSGNAAHQMHAELQPFAVRVVCQRLESNPICRGRKPRNQQISAMPP